MVSRARGCKIAAFDFRCLSLLGEDGCFALAEFFGKY